MAKAKTERTAKQKALDAASKKYDDAKAAHEKKPTDQTRAALESALKERMAAAAPVRRENFVRVAGGRVKKARDAIRQLGAVNNTKQYTYNDADIANAEKVLSDAIAAAIANMRAGLAKPGAAPKEDEAPIFAE